MQLEKNLQRPKKKEENTMTFELIFENPYSNAMVTTLFVPTKEVKKYSDTYFKVKSIDYQPE